MNFAKEITVDFGNDRVLKLFWSFKDDIPCISCVYTFNGQNADLMREKFGLDYTDDEEEFFLDKVPDTFKKILHIDPKIGRDYTLSIYNKNDKFIIVYEYVDAVCEEFNKLMSLFADKPRVISFY